MNLRDLILTDKTNGINNGITIGEFINFKQALV